MTVATITALLVAALPLLLLVVFTTEVIAGLQAQTTPLVEGPLPRTVVLMPAHDEAADIVTTITALRAITDPAIDLLVVADNCTDDTAALARTAGARVIERCDPARRGKGYALAFGRDHLALTPPDCVVVLDADCTVAGAGIAALARAAIRSKRAVQACNLQRPDLAGSHNRPDFQLCVPDKKSRAAARDGTDRRCCGVDRHRHGHSLVAVRHGASCDCGPCRRHGARCVADATRETTAISRVGANLERCCIGTGAADPTEPVGTRFPDVGPTPSIAVVGTWAVHGLAQPFLAGPSHSSPAASIVVCHRGGRVGRDAAAGVTGRVVVCCDAASFGGGRRGHGHDSSLACRGERPDQCRRLVGHPSLYRSQATAVPNDTRTPQCRRLGAHAPVGRQGYVALTGQRRAAGRLFQPFFSQPDSEDTWPLYKISSPESARLTA